MVNYDNYLFDWFIYQVFLKYLGVRIEFERFCTSVFVSLLQTNAVLEVWEVGNIFYKTH